MTLRKSNSVKVRGREGEIGGEIESIVDTTINEREKRRGDGVSQSPIRQFSSQQSDFDVIKDLFFVFDHVGEYSFFDPWTKRFNAWKKQ